MSKGKLCQNADQVCICIYIYVICKYSLYMYEMTVHAISCNKFILRVGVGKGNGIHFLIFVIYG